MSSMASRSKATRIESSANGDWRLIQGDQSPRKFTAEDIVVLLEDNAKDKARMEELEKKLDELSSFQDERERKFA
jgi:hypothetical protein